jgi:hypothetical protein
VAASGGFERVTEHRLAFLDEYDRPFLVNGVNESTRSRAEWRKETRYG